jgi:flagellar hook-associated protein 1
MSLTQALGTALAGLRANQAGLAIVSANVANAETPGYVRKRLGQEAAVSGDFSIGVRVTAVNRELDTFIQRQLQVETSGGAYADLRAQLYQRLQQVYGQPGSDSTLASAFNKFTAALQALVTSPDSSAARSATLSSAQTVAQQLNGTSGDIQQIRGDIELGLADAVQQANEAIRTIARINQELAGASAGDATTASLLDQRDAYIAQLSELMDIRVVPTGQNQVTVFTNSGVQLVGIQPSQLTFDGSGGLTAASAWSADPAQRSAGTITLVGPTGGDIDLIATNAIRSGKIAAYLEMRDQVLPQAQAQLDELAAAMASALSDKATGGVAASSGAQAGFDLDTAGLLPGNRIDIAYTDNLTGTARKITLVRVEDPAALPLTNAATSSTGDAVVGVSFAGGMAAVAAALNAALGATGLQFSNPSGTTLRVLDDGAANRVDVNAASTTTTATTLTGGSAELPFFVDGDNLYTGAIRSFGPQSVGLAGRIAVNRALLADPSRLSLYRTAPATPAGDVTRPNFLYDRLTQAALTFSPRGGIGTPNAPFTGSLPAYLRQLISQQGEAAAAADNLKQGQDVVVNSLRQRLDDSARVDVDTEMANLLSLQTAYGANARVMSTVRDLLDLLMKM